MVVVDMNITKGMDELTRFEVAKLGHHQGEQGIGGNVKWYTEEYVGTALVELAAEFSIGHVKLEQGMTGHQGHFGKVGYIPGTDDQAPAVRVCFDLADQIRNLVDGFMTR